MGYSLRSSVLLAAVLVATATASWAQPVWNLELVGGIAISDLTGDTGAGVFFSDDVALTGDIGSSKIGGVFGGFVTVLFNDNFGLQSGAQWIRKGGEGEVGLQADIPGVGIVNLSADVAMTLDYIEFPLLAVLVFPAGESAAVRFVAGPTLAINTNADVEVSALGFSESADIGDFITGTDFGGLVGAGLAVPVGGVDLVFDARYAFGLQSIDDSGLDIDLKNRAFEVLGGVSIPIGGR